MRKLTVQTHTFRSQAARANFEGRNIQQGGFIEQAEITVR